MRATKDCAYPVCETCQHPDCIMPGTDIRALLKRRQRQGREESEMGRKIILYDLYKNDEYQGRYKAKELMYLLGMSRETIASRVYHGVKTKDGYEIMRAEPDGWAESWERACAPLRRK